MSIQAPDNAAPIEYGHAYLNKTLFRKAKGVIPVILLNNLEKYG